MQDLDTSGLNKLRIRRKVLLPLTFVYWKLIKKVISFYLTNHLDFTFLYIFMQIVIILLKSL